MAATVTVWNCGNPREVVPGVISPMGQHLIGSTMNQAMIYFMQSVGVDVDSDAIFIGFFAGRGYMNMNVALATSRQMPGRTLDEVAKSVGFDLKDYPGDPETDFPPVKGMDALRPLWGLMAALRRAPERIRAETPGISNRLTQLNEGDVTQRSAIELLDQSQEISDLVDRVTRRYVQCSYLGGAVWEILEKSLLPSWIGGQGGKLLADLAAGFGTTLARTGLQIQELALLACQDKDVSDAILNDGKELADLRARGKGTDFFVAWDRFMQEHGDRALSELDILHPRWSEKPAFLLQVLRGYLRNPDKIPTDTAEQQQRRRQAAEEEIRRHLCRNWVERLLPIRFAIVHWLLDKAEFFLTQREELKWMWVRSYAIMRRIYLEIAGRWKMERRDDIFFLRPDQVRGVIDGSLTLQDAQDLVDSCRQEHQRNLKIEPPETIVGDDWSPDQLPAHEQVAENDMLETPGVLRGIGCNPGLVKGPARVIRDPVAEADQLQPGEILVTRQTDPAWTPLLMRAQGVVTELGGVLSHAAIVAREFGIPSVVSVADALLWVRDGQTIVIDGQEGTVTLLESVPHL